MVRASALPKWRRRREKNLLRPAHRRRSEQGKSGHHERVDIELSENENRRAKLGDFERVTADQIGEAKRKRDDAEEAED
jgi:hypothetical protein